MHREARLLGRPFSRRTAGRPVANAAITVGIALAASATLQTVLVGAPVIPLLLAGPGLLVLAAVVTRGTEWAVVVLVGATTVGLYRSSVTVGPVDLRLTDAGYVLVFLAVLVDLRRHGTRPASDIGQAQLALLLGVAGLSLVPVVTAGTADLSLIVSWLRLVATFSLVWLVPMGVRTTEQRHFVLAATAGLIGIDLLRSLLTGDGPGGRLAGTHGPNTTGLLAVILVILVLHGEVTERPWLRAVAVGIGISALVSSRSIGSIAALGIVLGLFGLARNRSLDPRAQSLLRPARMLLLLIGVIALIGLLRPGNLPGDSGFENSTTAHRIVLGRAGLELLADNPVLGVGWQRSSSAEIIGEFELNEDLRRRYPDFRDEFFPDRNPSGVHNAYIQVLAETGLVGGLALGVVVVVVGRRTRHLLRRLPPGSTDATMARSAALVVLAVMVWLNDNALYGAQPESILIALALGVVAATRVPPATSDAPDAVLARSSA